MDPTLNFLLFRTPSPQIKVTREKALAATSPALIIMDLGNKSLYKLCPIISSKALLFALCLVATWVAFACTMILPTICLISLMISLGWLVVPLESLLNYAMNNRGEAVSENMIFFWGGVRAVKTKTHFGFSLPEDQRSTD
jgi:hypothetical protein